MSIEKLGQVWPEWKVETTLGEGSFGKVYKAVREEHGMTTYSAIKIISIPQSDAELTSMRSEGWSEGATKSYFQGIVDDFTNEIKLMESMKGTPNIVSVEDYKVIEKTDKVGWDIFIRMELLTSFLEYSSDKKLSEAEVIKLGEDILGALDLCAQRKIIHRDIKPENIFISSFGYFKLGDFGIARELEKTAGSMSQKGTYNYIAPEIPANRHYDATVDTYSLGLVLYRLLNNNRLPFIDPKAQLVQYQDRQNALSKRLNGEPLPTPIEASKSMAQVILKACAFNPKDRYQSPAEFKQALEAVKAGMEMPKFVPSIANLDASGTIAVRPAPQIYDEPHNNRSVEQFGKKKKKTPKIAVWAIIVVLLGGLGAGAYFYLSSQSLVNTTNKVIEALQSGNFSEATTVFSDNVNDINVEAMESALLRRLDELKAEFKDGTTDYNMVKMELNTISGFNLQNLTNKISIIEQYVESLNDSRVAFSLAETLLANGDYPSAIEQYKLVSMEDENYTTAKKNLSTAISQYKQSALSESSALADNKDYGRALDVLDSTLAVIGNDADLAGRRETYHKQGIADKISDAKALADSGNYNDATNELKLLKAQNPDNTDVSKALSDVETSHVNAIVLQASGLTTENNYEDALAILNEGMKQHPENLTLKNALNDTHEKEINHIIVQSANLANEQKYEEAISLLQTQGSRYPNSSEISAKIVEYTAFLPVYLEMLETLSDTGANGEIWILTSDPQNDYRDNTENKYINGVGVRLWGWDRGGAWRKIEYFLDKKYTRFKGTLFLSFETKDDLGSVQLRILADDELLYTSPDITHGVLPLDIDLDITNATKLILYFENNNHSKSIKVALGNAVLYK